MLYRQKQNVDRLFGAKEQKRFSGRDSLNAFVQSDFAGHSILPKVELVNSDKAFTIVFKLAC